MSRLALSCRWLSSAILSVATLSISLLSPWLPTSTNVKRKGNNREAFDGLTPRKRLGRSLIVTAYQNLTYVVEIVRETTECEEDNDRTGQITTSSAAVIKTQELPALQSKRAGSFGACCLFKLRFAPSNPQNETVNKRKSDKTSSKLNVKYNCIYKCGFKSVMFCHYKIPLQYTLEANIVKSLEIFNCGCFTEVALFC